MKNMALGSMWDKASIPNPSTTLLLTLGSIPVLENFILWDLSQYYNNFNSGINPNYETFHTLGLSILPQSQYYNNNNSGINPSLVNFHTLGSFPVL